MAAVPKAAATVRAMIFFSILNLLDVGLVVLLGGFCSGLAATNAVSNAKVVRSWVTRCNAV
jgi:hypothetical protein